MQIRLGEIMRELRRQNGRTQEDLAQALGVTSQAVSRWEKGICYPDMELIPSMANYFGVTIDELFGYDSEREARVDELAERIDAMNCENNGRDVSMEACIQLARESLAEFPGNERLMLSLASALYNAGYVRYGEHHLTDQDGYGIFDTSRHREYAEWQEAIKLYEKLLVTMEEGVLRHQAVQELLQLYVNTGEYEKAAHLADIAPDLSCCREFLQLNACDGKKRVEAFEKAMLTTLRSCSDLMRSCVTLSGEHLSPAEAVQILKNSIALYDLVFTDGDYGIYHAELVCQYMYLSEHLWRAGDHDGAFDALDSALEHATAYEAIRAKGEIITYTSPLLRLIKHQCNTNTEAGLVKTLAEDWPWWFDFAYSQVSREIKADPRWEAWVKRLSE